MPHTQDIESAGRALTTAQDLIDAKLIPKDSQTHLAMILTRRLTKLRAALLSSLTPQMLGEWRPLFEKDHKLRRGVVANESLGHRIRFKKAYDSKAGGKKFAVLANRKGSLLSFDRKTKRVTLRMDDDKNPFSLGAADAEHFLEVSSLGQLDPLDKERALKKQTLAELFPKTVLDQATTEDLLVALLMGRDLLLYGPPGSGKSNVAKDIIALGELQRLIFITRGCQSQCNPFSLIDPSFAEEVPPCPECLLNHDPQFKRTGRFKRPDPKDVKIIVAQYGEGMGIEFTEGTLGMNRMHLAGYKLPKLDGSTTEGRESDYDPEGFHGGVLPRTNNGILHMDEMDKLRPQALDNILEALNSNRIKPDQLRYSYPSHQLIVGTANDATKFSDALNDRMLFLQIDYPEDAESSYAITRRAYHKETLDLGATDVGDTHRAPAESLRDHLMPIPVERAIDSFYIKLRKDYQGAGKTPILASNRSKIDALDAARAFLVLDGIFFEKTPKIATADYAIKGVQYALHSRVQASTDKALRRAREDIQEWVQEEFPNALAAEEDVWWCETYKHIAIAQTQIPEIERSFKTELKEYPKKADFLHDAYLNVQKAHRAPDDLEAQRGRLSFPFLDHLFSVQPGFSNLERPTLIALMEVLLKSRARSRCTAEFES